MTFSESDSIMNPIKEKVNHIGEKYNLNSRVEDLFIYKKYAEIWHEKTSNLDNGSVVIYGAGGGAVVLLRMLHIFNEEKKVAYIIDSDLEKTELLGVPVKHDFLSLGKDVKMIWISSFNYAKDMESILKSCVSNIEYVNPYDELAKIHTEYGNRDIAFSTNFLKYNWFWERAKERHEETDPEMIRKISYELIAGYFYIYDWVNLDKEINRYIENDYSDKDTVLELKKDIDGLFCYIRELLAGKNDNIVIYTVDALSKSIASGMEGLCKWKKSACEFSEYKCIYPGTREILDSLLTGWKPFEDKTFMGKKILFEDSPLLNKIKSDGLKLKLLTDDYNVCIDYKNVNSYETKDEENSLISEVMFNGLCELAESDDRQIIILHTDNTVHFPHVIPHIVNSKCWENEISIDEFRVCMRDAAQYTDEILYFYMNLIDSNDSISQIVMGDHGFDESVEYYNVINPQHMRNDGQQWNRDLIDTFLAVKSKYCEKGICDKLVSSVSFNKIIYSLVNKTKIDEEEISSDNIEIQWVPGWDSAYIDRGLTVGNYYYSLGALGCFNKAYMYVNTEEDEDLFYEVKEDEVIQISDEERIPDAIESLGNDLIKRTKFPSDLLKLSRFSVHNEKHRVYRNK